MRDAAAHEERRTRKITDWLLAVLRFAVTRAETDRAVALAVAAEMDRSGSHPDPTAFSFFTRTTLELCDVIAHKDDPRRVATLARHLARIDDRRLRRALEVAIELKQATPASPTARKRGREHLWKGLRHKPTA